MIAKTKRWLQVGAAPLALGLTLLAAPQASRADVTCIVTKGSAPASVKVGESLNVTFNVNVSGKPNANNECEISNLRYNWTVTVTGSDGGSVTYNSTGTSASASHTANNKCQSYTVSASCTVSYDTSKECSSNGQTGSGSKSGSDSASIAVEETPCE